MAFMKILAKLPIDLAQGTYRETTKGKLIAFAHIPAPQPGATALDVGCGEGYWSEQLKKKGYRVTSIDQERTYPNEDSEYRYAHMQPADANQTLPFRDNSFDLVWSSEVIEHVQNYRIMSSEIMRVLKPGGRYILTTPNSYFWLYYFLKMFGIGHQGWQNEGHVNFFSLNDMQRLFPDAVILGYFPYTLIRATIRRGIALLSPTLVVIGQKKG